MKKKKGNFGIKKKKSFNTTLAFRVWLSGMIGLDNDNTIFDYS